MIKFLKMSKSKSRSSRKHSNSSDESLDSAEEERLKDIKERDEFSDRLKKKDEGKTRRVVEVSSSYAFFFFKFVLITIITITRHRNAKDTKRQQNVLNYKMRIEIKFYHSYVYSHAENIWKSGKMIKLPNWKQILTMMNICLKRMCKFKLYFVFPREICFQINFQID